jgi:hypothetical protein
MPLRYRVRIPTASLNTQIMGLIDDYITLYGESMTVEEMSKGLGLATSQVQVRLDVLKGQSTIDITLSDEKYALLNFIEVKGHGVWVDIARRRLLDVDKIIKRTT